MGSNILIICVNIMLFLDVINIWNLGGSDFIIFITVRSWCDKVRIVRIILKVVLGRSRTKFIFNVDVKLLTILLFSWGLDLILSERSD
jgi:hypothetical protein